MGIKNFDLDVLHNQLADMAAKLLADGVLMPTALTMARDGSVTIHGSPADEEDEEAGMNAILRLRRTCLDESKSGRLMAYGLMFPDESDVPNGPAKAEAIVFVLEHECGDAIKIFQRYKKIAAGKVEMGISMEQPLAETFRIWKPGSVPAAKAKPAIPAENDPEPLDQAGVLRFVEQIPMRAKMFCKATAEANGMELDYTAASIPKLDQIILKNWPYDPAGFETIVLAFGSYLGETIRAIHGGNWAYKQELGFHLEIGKAKPCPYSQMRKRLVHGSEASLGKFYDTIRGEIEKESKPSKPPPIPPAVPGRVKSKTPALAWAIIAIAVALLASAGYAAFNAIKVAGHAWEQVTQGKIILPAATNAPASTTSTNGNDPGVTVLYAEFGLGGKVANVTDRVIALLQEHPEGFAVNVTNLGVDPAPTHKKRLVIRYEYQGSNYVFTIQSKKQVSNQRLIQNAAK